MTGTIHFKEKMIRKLVGIVNLYHGTMHSCTGCKGKSFINKPQTANYCLKIVTA